MLRKCSMILLVLSLLLASVSFAKTVKVPIKNLPVAGGSFDVTNNLKVAPNSDRFTLPSSLDSVGTLYQAGTTYYDYQHNGTAGHMVSVDSLGYVHVVWMNGLNSGLSTRHAYYNVWDPSSQSFILTGGGQINSSVKAGYACSTVLPNGFCFPAFHEVLSSDPNPHTSSSIDFLPQSGAFTSFQPSYLYENNSSLALIWPKIDHDRNGKLHVVATESPASGVAGDPKELL